MWPLLLRAGNLLRGVGARLGARSTVSSGIAGHAGGVAAASSAATAAATGGLRGVATSWGAWDLLGRARKAASGYLPEIEYAGSVIAIGFPWADNNAIYQFAMSVAFGLIDNNPDIKSSNFTSQKHFAATISHTEKVIKIEYGWGTSGIVGAVFEQSGRDVLNAQILSTVVGGQRPINFLRDKDHPGPISISTKPLPYLPEQVIDLTGKTMLTDEPSANSTLPYPTSSPGSYGYVDLLLQVEPLNAPCQPIKATPTQQLIKNNLNKLLGIS